MGVFAEIILQPGGVIAWLVVGVVAGFLAGKVMRGAGYGLIGDIVTGLIGGGHETGPLENPRRSGEED